MFYLFIFLRFNCRIVLQTIKIMCRIFFKKVDHIDCKIIAFEVKKRVFLQPAKQVQQILNLLGLKLLYYTKLRLLLLC
jgi:hypothetical protein